MSFQSASLGSYSEIEDRRLISKNRLRFGIDFLDDAFRGILPDDMVLLGAPSGIGKTQLCCNIALSNLELGKRVYYIALEASKFEIERRLKFPLVMERFFADPNRPILAKRVNFPDWVMGDFLEDLKDYEEAAAAFFESSYKDLFLYYKHEKFGVAELCKEISLCADDADLILIDHVHYFDFDDDNENRAIKKIAKTIRDLALEEKKPIILVAHLRKKDRNNADLVAGYEEFHGSSDLYKIATKVVTMAPGPMTDNGCFETYFRIPKNRMDGGVMRFIGRELFNPKKGGYERGAYKLGWAESKVGQPFSELTENFRPDWARANSCGGDSSPQVRLPGAITRKMGKRAFARNEEND